MKKIFNFISEYWVDILGVLSLVAVFIVFILPMSIALFKFFWGIAIN